METVAVASALVDGGFAKGHSLPPAVTMQLRKDSFAIRQNTEAKNRTLLPPL